MAFTAPGAFTFNHADQADRPSATAAQRKTDFDSRATLLRNYIINTFLVELARVTDGSSGADNIGMTAITETGANATVQSIIEALITRLKAVTDSASGADLIGMTTITETGAAATVQAVVEALITRLKAVTDSSSGADLIGTTAITSLGAAATVQAILEALAPMTTQGDILYQGASAPARLAKGTAAQFLKMNAGATAPEWVTDAVTQNGMAAGISSGPTTSSTSYVDLTDMSVTLTTTGGDLLVFAVGTFYSGTAGTGIYTGLSLDGAAEVGIHGVNAAAINYGIQLINIYRFTGVSAASHTVKTRWRVGVNSAVADGVSRYLLVVEVKR